MISVVDVVVRVDVVVTLALADAEGCRNRPAVSLNHIVLHRIDCGTLASVSAGVGLPDADPQNTDVVESAVFDGVVGGHGVAVDRHAVSRRTRVDAGNELQARARGLGHDTGIERDVLRILERHGGADVRFQFRRRVSGRGNGVVVVLECQSAETSRIGGSMPPAPAELRDDHPVGIRVLTRVGQISECPWRRRPVQKPLARLREVVFDVIHQISVARDEASSC